MSDTKPHQDAVDAIDEYRDIIQWAELRTDMTEQDCRELVGMVKREARAFADAELAAEREAIAVFVGERAQEYAWQDGPYYMGLANAYGKIVADVRSRTNSPSPLDPARSYIAALAAELDEARAALAAEKRGSAAMMNQAVKWEEIARSDCVNCAETRAQIEREARTLADAELRAALAPLYRDGDTVMLDTQSIHDKIWCFVAERMNELSAAQHQQIVAQVKELLDLAARVYNAESLVRYRDIEIDSLKATVNDLQLIITSMKS